MQFKVSPEKLEEISLSLKGEGDKFEECISIMNELIKQIPEAWEGQAAGAFEVQFDELRPGFQQVRELIESIGDQIAQVIEVVEKMDKDIASKLQ